jgi:tryptophan synthase alpha chain
MSYIEGTFEKQKKRGIGTLIGYVMAGDPNLEMTVKIAGALVKGGVDILELGLPFSDPIADGPTIQAASLRALKAETTPQKVLEIAKRIKQLHSLPIAIMTYYNPVFKMGLNRFFNQAKICQVDGTIIPDLPLEEASEYRKAAKTHGINTIFLASPSTSDPRLAGMVAATSGFLYLVSHFGVTGVKSTIGDPTICLIKRVLPFTADKVPLAVGFGISQPEHVQSIMAAGADGVIVGSAFVNIIAANSKNTTKMLSELEATARLLKEATAR